MTQRVLLVGATSPIGTAIGAELARRSIATSRTARTAAAGIQRLDVNNEQATSDILSALRPTTIVYLASPRGDLADEAATALRSLRRFTEQAARAGAKTLVFASSAAVYGTTHRAPRLEDDALEPQSNYAQMKVAAEAVLAEASTNLGLGVLSLRVFNAYGPRLNSSLINRMFLPRGESPEVLATSEFVRDYVHVNDIARAFASAVTSATTGFVAVNVGTGVGVDNLTLLALPGAHARTREVPRDFLSHSIATTTKMRALLDVVPRVRVEDAAGAANSFLS